MLSFGKSRAADSASAMPSMTGIWISVSSRSKPPSSRLKMSSASAPSCAVTVSWPSIAIARATSERMESSSSAIRIRGICQSIILRGSALRPAGKIAAVEETDVDIAAFRRRRGEARLELHPFAGLQHGLLQNAVPGIDLRALRIADGKAQPWQIGRFAGFADDRPFDHQHRLALHCFSRDLDVLERKPAQIDIEADHFIEARGLRHQADHLAAPDDQRNRQG